MAVECWRACPEQQLIFKDVISGFVSDAFISDGINFSLFRGCQVKATPVSLRLHGVNQASPMQPQQQKTGPSRLRHLVRLRMQIAFSVCPVWQKLENSDRINQGAVLVVGYFQRAADRGNLDSIISFGTCCYNGTRG